MAERGTAHEALRSATAADHERLDKLFGRFRLGDPADYRAFLKAHAMALPAIEQALDAEGFGARLEDWAARHRAEAIAADLAALGEPMPASLAAPALETVAAHWGAAYVVEGSRLGGAMLARSVAEGLPTAYLGGPQAPGAWRGFLKALDAAVRSPEEMAQAAQAARATFALFEQAGRMVIAKHAGSHQTVRAE